MNNPIGWFEIYVDDMARARAFYEKVFGTRFEKLPSVGGPSEMLAFPMDQGSAGAGGALVKMDGLGAGVGGTMIYFNCDDCAVEAKKAADSGGRVQNEKFAIGQYGFCAHVVDTEGNVIGLHSMR